MMYLPVKCSRVVHPSIHLLLCLIPNLCHHRHFIRPPAGFTLALETLLLLLPLSLSLSLASPALGSFCPSIPVTNSLPTNSLTPFPYIGFQNRMHESLALFYTTIHSPWFFNTSIILFLNKTDILADKVQTSDLQKYFPSFTGKRRRPVCVR